MRPNSFKWMCSNTNTDDDATNTCIKYSQFEGLLQMRNNVFPLVLIVMNAKLEIFDLNFKIVLEAAARR